MLPDLCQECLSAALPLQLKEVVGWISSTSSFAAWDNTILEDRLSHSDGQCTTKDSKESDASHANGDVFNIKDGMNSQKRYFDAHTSPYTGKDLAAKPFRKGCVDIEGRNKCRTDSKDDAANDAEGSVGISKFWKTCFVVVAPTN